MLKIAITVIAVGVICLMVFESYGLQFHYGTQQRMLHFMGFNVLCGIIAPSHWRLKEFRWIWGLGNLFLILVPITDEPYSLIAGF